MDVTIQMKIFINVKHRPLICLKFEGWFFTSLTMLVIKAKASTVPQSKKN